jgi:hypothetical protein
MTSPDGTTWTVRDTPLTGVIWKCIYANGLFIAAGAFSTTQNQFIYSIDGITWRVADTPALNNWGGFAYGNGMLVAISFNGPDNSALVVKSGELNSFITQNDNITHGKQTFTDDVVLNNTNRLGIGTSAPIGRLVVASGNTLLGQNTDSGQRLQVNGDTLLKGSGNTSATIALTIQDSTGSNMFRMYNHGGLLLERTSSITSSITSHFNLTSTFNPTSGSGQFYSNTISPTINQTGGANGITRGLYVNPTLTSAADFRAIETSAGNVLFGSNFFWDNTNGRLGIGTTSPIGSIETYGTSLYVAGAFSIYSNTAANEALFYFRRGRGTLTSPLSVQSGDVLGSLRFAGQFSSVVNEYTTQAKIDSVATSNGAVLRFFTNSSGLNNSPSQYIQLFGNGNLVLQNGGTFTDSGERLQVQGTTLLNGNVTFSSATGMTWDATNSRLGIGTNTPQQKLDVLSTDIAEIKIKTSTNTGAAILRAYNDLNNTASFGIYGSTRTATGTLSSGDGYMFANNDIAIASNGNVKFGNTTNERMRIWGSTGNVLIQNGGTFSDSGERLQVTGAAKIIGNINMSGEGPDGDGANRTITGGRAAQLANIVLFNASTGKIHLNSWNGSGVAINGPLSVSGGITFTGSLILSPGQSLVGAGSSFVTPYDGGTGNFIVRAASSSEAFSRFRVQTGTTPTDRLIVYGNGNVIIQSGGTFTDSGEKLQVTGTAKITGLTTFNAGISLSNFTNIDSGNNQIRFESFRMKFATAGNTLTTQYGYDFASGVACTLSSGYSGRFTLSSWFAPTSGTAEYVTLYINPIINQTGGANGVTRGLFVNPTLTSAADFRAIEVSAGISVLAPSTTASATLRIPSGTAPTTPSNGDIWFDGTDLKMRIGGVTKTFTLV